jgi:hypothetical protein
LRLSTQLEGRLGKLEGQINSLQDSSQQTLELLKTLLVEKA